MLEKFKQKWLEWLVAVVLIIITTIATNYATVKRETSSSIKQQIEQKADKSEVEKRDAEIKLEIKTGDDNIKQMLDQHTKAQSEILTSIDSKLNILLSRTK